MKPTNPPAGTVQHKNPEIMKAFMAGKPLQTMAERLASLQGAAKEQDLDTPAIWRKDLDGLQVTEADRQKAELEAAKQVTPERAESEDFRALQARVQQDKEQEAAASPFTAVARPKTAQPCPNTLVNGYQCARHLNHGGPCADMPVNDLDRGLDRPGDGDWPIPNIPANRYHRHPVPMPLTLPPTPDPDNGAFLAIRTPVAAEIMQTLLDLAGMMSEETTLTTQGEWTVISRKA